jgi:cytochrome c5
MRKSLLALSVLGLAACGKPAERPAASGTAAAAPLNTQERRLLAAATILLPPEGLKADSLPDPRSRGAQMVVAYCTQCHALPSPATHAAQDWPAVARRMWVRIDMLHGDLGVAVPAEGDRVAMLNYLMANALKVTDHLPDGAGRDVFSAMCSRCHLLPDPRQHSPADWPAVIERMERNMERMKVSGLSHEQAQSIIGYLGKVSRRS